MKKFRVVAEISYLLACEIEAEDYTEAREKAIDLDGGDFKEVDGSSMWNIDAIEEIEQ